MNYQDAAHVLAVCAAYDNRQPSQAAAMAWAADLGDITREEAVQGVRDHYRERPDEWIKPGHVIAIVKRFRRTGLDQSHRLESVMLRDVDPDDPGAVINTLHRARAMAAHGGAMIPTARTALGAGRYESIDGQADRNRRGRAAVDAILAEHTARWPRPDGREPAELTASERTIAAARERARAEKSRRHSPSDPMALGAALRRFQTPQRSTRV